MRNSLLAASALAFAGAMGAGPASAADKMSVGLGGYMEQWFGYADRSDKDADGGFDVQSDSEIYFLGSLESDMGLKFGVRVQLEANNEIKNDSDNTEIDESSATVSGDFGMIEIGQRDPVHARMHYAAGFGAGVGLNAGDSHKWIPGVYLETAGWTIPGDNLNVTYMTPRMNGVQVGVSYGPDSKSENSVASAPTDNDDAVWAAAVNFSQPVGGMALEVSLGHANVSNTGMTGEFTSNNATSSDTNLVMMKGFDDKTFTNMGVSLGMGAFSFAASYATRDDGGYTLMCMGDHDKDTGTDAVAVKCGSTNAYRFAGVAGGGVPGNTNTDVVVPSSVMAVEDKSMQSDTFAVGVTYTDGPMSVSLDHMTYERENGDERVATMVSAGYALAPGIAWKSSVFGVEDDTEMSEGTVFVTGLDIHF